MTIWPFGARFRGEARLAEAWASAPAFPHVVIDDLLPDEHLAPLLAAIDEEPLTPRQADAYAFEASDPEPRTDVLRAIRKDFARDLMPVVNRLSQRSASRIDMRAYAYREGHYLLPHTDHRDDVGRLIAYAYYLPTPAPPTGGELDLFACAFSEDGDLSSTELAETILPSANRLVLFEVSPRSLHEVREVTAGLRISLSGWFYP